MRGPARFVPWLCLLACCGCGKKEKSTAELIEDLKSPHETERLIAVRLLSPRKSDAALVIPALTEVLKDKSDEVRISAALGLGSYGEQAKEAVPALQAALQDHDRRVREAVGKAIGRIDPGLAPKAVPPNKR